MEKVTDLYMVRHGTTTYNREQRFRGRTKMSVDAGGRKQARAAAQVLLDMEITAIFTSPLPRAVETAEIMSEVLGSPMIEEEGLIDVDYGAWQGLTVDEVKGKFGEEMMRSWVEDPVNFSFPQGERLSDARERLEATLPRLGREHQGKAIVVVTHLALLKLAYIIAQGINYSNFIELTMDNGSVSHLRYDDGKLELRKWNFRERVS